MFASNKYERKFLGKDDLHSGPHPFYGVEYQDTLLILKTFTCLLLMQRYRQTSMQKNHESEEIAITRDFRASRMRSPRRSVHSSAREQRRAVAPRVCVARPAPTLGGERSRRARARTNRWKSKEERRKKGKTKDARHAMFIYFS